MNMPQLSGNHAHRSGTICAVPECQYAPRAVSTPNGTVYRCRCGNYPQTDVYGTCTVCRAGFYADWEWELLTGETVAGLVDADSEDAGFMETDSLASDAAIDALRNALNRPDFSVTVTVHTLDGKSFPVPGIREDSITWENRKGVPTLVMERDGSDAIVYAPNVAYYVTVCE